MQGTVSLALAERIKALRRERFGNADLSLCDYFDLTGGTSTGSIIATGLAPGCQVRDRIGSRHRMTAPALAFPVIQLVY
jgi:patatin-like phospholipase/acyl hydrolase